MPATGAQVKDLHFHHLKVSELCRDGDDALIVSFDVPEGLRSVFEFEPGQHVGLRHFAGGDELRRSYSICAAPGETLRVGVRRVASGKVSNWLHDSLQVGMQLELLPPQGRFGAVLADPVRNQGMRHVLGVAGGSGITPILSIMKTVLARHAHCRFTLIYGNRTAASTLFKEEIEDLKNSHLSRLALHRVFSREGVETALHSGRIDAAKVAEFMRLVGPVSEAFVCGPHAFNDEVGAALIAAGVAPEHIHIERFGVPSSATPDARHEPKPGDAVASQVRIVRDGVARDVPFGPSDRSILAAALRAGLDLPFSCQSGVCATCSAKLISGQVRMERNFALAPADIAAGFVLTCQARPLSDSVVVSFDER